VTDAQCIAEAVEDWKHDMSPKTLINELPGELIGPARRLDLLARSYLAAVSFIIQDTARDVRYWDNHLLSYLAHDFMQSSLAIVLLGTEGMLTVAKREVRFIVEASIKLCLGSAKGLQVRRSQRSFVSPRRRPPCRRERSFDLNGACKSAASVTGPRVSIPVERSCRRCLASVRGQRGAAT
jgi:hypothetical protein